MTEEFTADLINDEELDEVAGGKSMTPGNKMFITTRTTQIYDTFKTGGRQVIGTVAKNTYLRGARLVVVGNTGKNWISFTQYGRRENGPWTNKMGWVEANNCNQVY